MKVAFYTLGCKVNQYETDLMMKNFEDRGYSVVDFDDIADIYVINSCSVTNLSSRKSRQMASKAKRKDGIVVLAGCYAQELTKSDKLKNVDIVIGNEEKKQIVDIVERYIENGEKVEKVVYKVADISKTISYVQRDNLNKGINVRESVKIEDGCNNFCSYCIIPYVRGRVRSRNLDSILSEVNDLVNSGVGEIVLVGIEIASYGHDLGENISLIDVIEKVSLVPGLKRIRLGSLEPRILTDENIDRLSKIQNLCPHFHISVQSLDNNVLKRMNRKYTREDIFNIVDKIREKIEDVAFTCDIIVGFPGETEEEFENTIDGINRVQFYEVHTFKYSKRKWTRAAKMENQIDGKTATKRSENVIELAKKLKHQYLESYIGKKAEVLFESGSENEWYGYTKNYIKVKVRGDRNIWGCLLEVELDSIEEDMILGSICH